MMRSLTCCTHLSSQNVSLRVPGVGARTELLTQEPIDANSCQSVMGVDRNRLVDSLNVEHGSGLGWAWRFTFTKSVFPFGKTVTIHLHHQPTSVVQQ